jgi:hypothetical protein
MRQRSAETKHFDVRGGWRSDGASGQVVLPIEPRERVILPRAAPCAVLLPSRPFSIGFPDPRNRSLCLAAFGTLKDQDESFCFAAKEATMTGKKPLKPDDFPVETKENNIVTQKDEPVATTPSREKADDVARRLNEQAAREEEDRWSA